MLVPRRVDVHCFAEHSGVVLPRKHGARWAPIVVIDGINNFYEWPKVNGKNWGYKPVIRSIPIGP